MNKKNQIKPAIILCAIVAAVVLAIYFYASFVNGHVADRLSGRLLFVNDSDNLYLYDFKSKDILNITETVGADCCAEATFVSTDVIVMAGKAKIVKFSIEKKEIISEQVWDKGTILDFALCNKDERIYVLSVDNGTYYVSDEAGKEIYRSDNPIDIIEGAPSAHIIYASMTSKIIEINADNGNTVTLHSGDNTVIDMASSDTLIMHCVDNKGHIEAYSYNITKKRNNSCDINRQGLNITSVANVNDSIYIVSAVRNDKITLEVCNGSNMQELGAISAYRPKMILDYIQE